MMIDQKPKKVPIKEKDGLIRDTKNGAVLNKDLSSLQKYRAKRDRDRQMRQEFEQMKHDMSEIKTLLHKLVNRD
jgi:predicted transcriptional regulator